MQNAASLARLSYSKVGGVPNVKGLLTGLVNTYGGVYYPMNETANSVTKAVNPALATGRDIVINGDFATDTIWTKGAGWTITGGKAVAAGTTSAADLQQASILKESKSYEVTYTISDYSAGQIRVRLGTAVGTIRSADGTYTETITAAGAEHLRFTTVAGQDFTGKIDDVSVKQKTIAASTAFPGSELLTDGDMENAGVGDWIASNNATLTKKTGTPHGGSQVLRILSDGTVNLNANQTILTIGKRYKVTGWTRSDGNAQPRIVAGGVTIFTGTTSTDWQEFNEEFTQVTNTVFSLRPATSVDGEYTEWDDVSITEVNPLNGDITGATVNVSAGAGLKKAYTFDGANDYVDIYSAELNSIFNPDKGTLLVFAKVSGSGVWTDSTARESVGLEVDSSNTVKFRKPTGSNRVNIVYAAGGTTEQVVATSLTSTDYIMYGITWDTTADGGNGEMKAYINGAQSGSTKAIDGTWVGNLASTTTTIGAISTVPSAVWDGDVCHVALLTEVLSLAQISNISRKGGTS